MIVIGSIFPLERLNSRSQMIACRSFFSFLPVQKLSIVADKRRGFTVSLKLLLPPIIIFVFLLLTRFFSHFHFFIEIFSKSMSFPLAMNHGYSDV